MNMRLFLIFVLFAAANLPAAFAEDIEHDASLADLVKRLEAILLPRSAGSVTRS